MISFISLISILPHCKQEIKEIEEILITRHVLKRDADGISDPTV